MRPRSASWPPTAQTVGIGGFHLSVDAAVGLGFGGALTLIAFVTTGGNDLGPNTWTEILLTLLGAGVWVAVLVIGGRGRRWGLATFALFVAFAALTAVSITWSVQPDQSWIAAGQILSYVAVFGGAIALARVFPERWPAVVGGIAVMAGVISSYALLAKVFPGTFDAADTVGRLSVPFDYWNATGLVGALGLAPCLWAGARRDRARALRALAAPAVTVLATAIVLSYSRGALVAAVIGLACWFAFVPLRLRGALVLAVGLAGALVVCIYALHTHDLTGNEVALAARTTAGHGFGVVLLLVLVLTTVAGLAAAFAMDRVPLPPPVRRRLGIALLAAVALVPVAGVVGLASSSRGLTGQISHVWSTLTSTNSGAPNAPGRLIELGNTRGRYWSEGLKVGEHAVLAGAGAFGYATAVTRYTTDAQVVPHAHSFVIQTFADLGLIGIALMLALLTAWSVAAARTLAPTGDLRHSAEWPGLLTLFAVVVTFGVHSAIDWTWFVPGTALPALACAGWIAGRGPLGEPGGRAAKRPRVLDSPGIAAACLAIAAAALIGAWTIYQPLHAQNADNAAIAALGRGDTESALRDASSGVSADPVGVDSLIELATIDEAIGRTVAAEAALQKAVHRQPENPQTWLALGQFYLRTHERAQALAALRRAQQLDLGSVEIAQAVAQAAR